jgi:hypothetical protein
MFPSRTGASLLLGAALAVLPGAAAAQTAKAGMVSTTLYVPEGVTKMRGVLAFTGVGLGSGWPNDAAFRAMAKRLELGVITVRGERSSGDDASYPVRCARGEFKQLLDALTELGKVSNHPELAHAPIIGGGHSHGGDYWNYFNACYPERMAAVFCKSAGGVQYSRAALRTPMVWEIGTNDLLNNSQGAFRGGMFAHRTKGSPLSLVLGPGEGHNNIGAGAKQMVIELLEAIFKLRVPANADPAQGPVLLNDIDETSGAYWLGDNYNKEIAPWAAFARKDALQRTSFLPNEELAMKWKAFPALPASIQVDEGVCSKCYKQLADEPPLKPISPGTPMPDAGAPPAADAGAVAAPDAALAPDAADETPAAPPPDAAVAAPARRDAAPPEVPDEVDSQREAPAAGGCALARRAPAAPLWLLAVIALLPALRRRR